MMTTHSENRVTVGALLLLAFTVMCIGFACSNDSEQSKQAEPQKQAQVTLKKTKLVYYALPG
ncbi:MAG: hypothetical protein ACE5IR_16065 [bacterium]